MIYDFYIGNPDGTQENELIPRIIIPAKKKDELLEVKPQN